MTKKELFATHDLSPLWISSIENVYPNDNDIVPESTLKLLGITPNKKKKNDNVIESIENIIKTIKPNSINPIIEYKDDKYYYSFTENDVRMNMEFSINGAEITCKIDFIAEEQSKPSNGIVKEALKDVRNALESRMPIITPKIFENEKVVTDFIEEYNKITYEIDEIRESLIDFIEEMTDK